MLAISQTFCGNHYIFGKKIQLQEPFFVSNILRIMMMVSINIKFLEEDT